MDESGAPAGAPRGRFAEEGPDIGKGDMPSATSKQSLRGLDWLTFFVADVQTGFGPFVAVYLTAAKWTQTDIGLIFTVGGLIGIIGQVPGGALVDAFRSTRLLAGLAVACIAASALALAAEPIFPVVLVSRILQAAASCILGPAIAALSIGLVRRSKIGERLGRNAAFASVGTGLTAAGMGACGYYFSNQAVFYVSALLTLPAFGALWMIGARNVGVPNDVAAAAVFVPATPESPFALFRNRALVTFAVCIMLFQLANAAMLPLVGSMLTLRSSGSATILIAIALIVPQLVVAVLSPWVGRKAQSWGRRPLLLIGFAALPIRALLLALVAEPQLLVVVQLLDGVSAAVIGVLTPLTVADATRDTGRFNLAQGMIGLAVSLGASISTTISGYLADGFGSSTAFMAMAVFAGLGFATLWLAMPETRPVDP